ncbi:hypothetical protein ACWKSP_25945 [Micromonosporaceae bacterium Da 78-11]
METALHSFFVSVPQAVAVWMMLLLGLALAAALMALPRKVPAPLPVPVTDSDHLRQVDEAAAAADLAAVTAGHRRDEWAAAQEHLDAAFAAFDLAEGVARQTTAACAFPLMSRRRKPGDNVDRERYLHHAATAACRNRDISIAQLNDVYAHRGWNPRLHPVVQEAALRQAVRAHRYAGYQRALERERAAWRSSEQAAETLRELRAEATAAIVHAGVGSPVAAERRPADQWATGELPLAA